MLDTLPTHVIEHIGTYLNNDDCIACLETASALRYVTGSHKKHVIYFNRNNVVNKLRRIRQGYDYLKGKIMPQLVELHFDFNWVDKECFNDLGLKFGVHAFAGIQKIGIRLHDALCLEEVLECFPSSLLSQLHVDVSMSWDVGAGFLDCVPIGVPISISIQDNHLHILESRKDMERIQQIRVRTLSHGASIDLSHIPYSNNTHVHVSSTHSTLRIEGANRITELDIYSIADEWDLDIDFVDGFRSSKRLNPSQPIRLHTIHIWQPIQFAMWKDDYSIFQLLEVLDTASVHVKVCLEHPDWNNSVVPNPIVVPFVQKLCQHAATRTVSLEFGCPEMCVVSRLIQLLVPSQKIIMDCKGDPQLVSITSEQTPDRLYSMLVSKSLRDAWALISYMQK